MFCRCEKERGRQVKNELYSSVSSFREIISIFEKMLNIGLISKEDFLKILTISAEEYGLKPYTILTDISGYM